MIFKERLQKKRLPADGALVRAVDVVLIDQVVQDSAFLHGPAATDFAEILPLSTLHVLGNLLFRDEGLLLLGELEHVFGLLRTAHLSFVLFAKIDGFHIDLFLITAGLLALHVQGVRICSEFTAAELSIRALLAVLLELLCRRKQGIV